MYIGLGKDVAADTNNTGGKIAAGVNDTGGQFASGVVDTWYATPIASSRIFDKIQNDTFTQKYWFKIKKGSFLTFQKS
jgi:hypothetical protein